MKLVEIFLISMLVFLWGCGSANTMYHWGGYSDSLYTYSKEPSAESRASHKAELVEIIDEAKSKKKGVPPGIHFELAMIEAEDGNRSSAIALFAEESRLFPEAEKYVGLALKELEAK